jgi:hypothetical protein
MPQDKNNKKTIARYSPFSFSIFPKEPNRDGREETLQGADIVMKTLVNTGKTLKQFIN